MNEVPFDKDTFLASLDFLATPYVEPVEEPAEENVRVSEFPNWEQARNDQSEPLPRRSPVNKKYLYFDHNLGCYVYDRHRKPQIITIVVQGKPEMTFDFMLKVRDQLPEYFPIPEYVPFALDACVYRSGSGFMYQVGESSTEWVKWITEHFEGSAWVSRNQITAVGCDVRVGSFEPRLVLTIIMA